MFDLDEALRAWRTAARRHALSGSELDELEDHLHSAYLAHVKRGSTPRRAFAEALRGLGPAHRISQEFRKLPGRAWRRLLRASWAMFAVAFFLPVVDGGITLLSPDLGEGLLPGFQAATLAFAEGGWYALSALTNLVMLGSMWRPAHAGRRRTMVLCGTMIAAAVLNAAIWLPEVGTDLRIGYFLWSGSFGLAAAGLLARLQRLGWRSLLPTVAT